MASRFDSGEAYQKAKGKAVAGNGAGRPSNGNRLPWQAVQKVLEVITGLAVQVQTPALCAQAQPQG